MGRIISIGFFLCIIYVLVSGLGTDVYIGVPSVVDAIWVSCQFRGQCLANGSGRADGSGNIITAEKKETRVNLLKENI